MVLVAEVQRFPILVSLSTPDDGICIVSVAGCLVGYRETCGASEVQVSRFCQSRLFPLPYHLISSQHSPESVTPNGFLSSSGPVTTLDAIATKCALKCRMHSMGRMRAAQESRPDRFSGHRGGRLGHNRQIQPQPAVPLQTAPRRSKQGGVPIVLLSRDFRCTLLMRSDRAVGTLSTYT